MDKRYYSLVKNEAKKEATLTIFGDITSWECFENDVSSYTLSKQLEEMTDVNTIHVRINSYGGEVAEGLAIYNALKNHKATVKTYCYGFACSIASVIFMAGDERLMSTASLLMIHNAWTWASGNAAELRKQADDLDKITRASINAYMQKVSITEEELKALLDSETWLEYNEAIEKGFATGVYDDDEETDKASQNARRSIFKMLVTAHEKEEIMTRFECGECGYIREGDLPEFFICPECGAGKDKFVEIDEEGNPVAANDDEGKNDDEDEKVEQDEGVSYECKKCGYIHEGELPEFFICPECGASKEEFVKVGEEQKPQEEDEAVAYECEECGYVHEGELPEFFICPECGAGKDKFVEVENVNQADEDDDELTDDEKKKANAQAANFFAKIAGGIE